MLAQIYEIWSGNKLTASYTIWGWEEDNKITGIAVFDMYTGANINVHIHGKNITRKKIRQAYSYVFEQLKCARMTATISRANKDFIRLIERFGFVYECTLSDFYGDPASPEDCLIYKLTREKGLEWIK